MFAAGSVMGFIPAICSLVNFYIRDKKSYTLQCHQKYLYVTACSIYTQCCGTTVGEYPIQNVLQLFTEFCWTSQDSKLPTQLQAKNNHLIR